MAISKGTWKPGKPWGTVVTENPEGFPPSESEESIEFYGGHLIAESIAKKDDQKLIVAAPDLLAACIEFVRKCECGEARSVRSYKQMKEAIAKATE